MVNIITDAEQLAVPAWVSDLESFRRWIDDRSVPEKARTWFYAGEVWVDMSKEQVFSHVLVKTKIAAALTALVDTDRLGMYLVDGVRLSHPGADLSVRPDGMFVGNTTLASGSVKLVEGMEEGYLELEGTPDMVLEVVSPTSVRKDKVLMRRAYWTADIPEYWLVDARQAPLTFEILLRKPRGYVPARKREGWARSPVFGKSFRLVQGTGPLGHPNYTLEMR